MHLVETSDKAPPYPPDTESRGWYFPLKTRQIKQSSAWIRAGRVPGLRNLLLRLWMESWDQIPIGSLPDDDETIAAMIEYPAGMFVEHRALIMHGWWKASDGRYYHRVITELVRARLGWREAERLRKEEYRHAKDAEIKELRERPGGVPRDRRGKDDTEPEPGAGGESTTKPKGKVKSSLPAPKSRAPRKTSCPEDFGISERVKNWAAREGTHSRPLEAHLKHFMSYVRRLAPVYADWDEALMTAIREDWLGQQLAKQERAKHGGKRFESAIDQSERIAAGLTGRKPGRVIDPD